LIEHVLDLYLREMQLDGFMERAWADYLARNQDSNCGTEENDKSSNNQRTLNEMAGTFLLHLLLTIVAVVIAFTSKLWAPKNEQQRYLGSSKTLSAIDRGGSKLSVLTNDPDPYGPATNDPSNFIGNETSAMTDGMFELQLIEMEFKIRRRQDAMQHQLDTILSILQPTKAEPGIASPEFDEQEEEITVLGYNSPQGLDIEMRFRQPLIQLPLVSRALNPTKEKKTTVTGGMSLQTVSTLMTFRQPLRKRRNK